MNETCLASDPRRLDQAFAGLTASLEHDDRGTRIQLSLAASSCGTCSGQWKIEDHAARVMRPCDVASRAARLKSLLAQVAPGDPGAALGRAIGVPLSPALVDRLHKSLKHRIGASFAPELPAIALAARAAWMFGARTAVFSVTDEVAAANPPGAPEIVFVHLDGKPWEQRTAEALDQWIGWCQRSCSALWVAAPVNPPRAPESAPGSAPGTKAKGAGRGWGRVSGQVAARVAQARERHWTGWLSSQARSRLLEVCEPEAFFDK